MNSGDYGNYNSVAPAKAGAVQPVKVRLSGPVPRPCFHLFPVTSLRCDGERLRPTAVRPVKVWGNCDDTAFDRSARQVVVTTHSIHFVVRKKQEEQQTPLLSAMELRFRSQSEPRLSFLVWASQPAVCTRLLIGDRQPICSARADAARAAHAGM
jgi:hypothetical protein